VENQLRDSPTGYPYRLMGIPLMMVNLFMEVARKTCTTKSEKQIKYVTVTCLTTC